MKYKSSDIIDVEIVKDLSWLKMVIRERYYRMRGWYWGLRNRVRMGVISSETAVEILLVVSIMAMAIMWFTLVYSLMGLEMAILSSIVGVVSLWANK